MRIPLLSMFMTSPFEGMQEHAEVIKDCSWAFQDAGACRSYKGLFVGIPLLPEMPMHSLLQLLHVPAFRQTAMS